MAFGVGNFFLNTVFLNQSKCILRLIYDRIEISEEIFTDSQLEIQFLNYPSRNLVKKLLIQY